MNSTRKYYEENSKSYFYTTYYNLPESLYKHFLSYIPEGGSIIDLGCGSGRDSKYFFEHKYLVEALDESTELCKIVKENLAIKVINDSIQNWEPENMYNGIWACASLLHLKIEDLFNSFNKIVKCIKENGVIFVSVKSGIETGYQPDGRYYTNFTEDLLENILRENQRLHLEKLWYTNDIYNRYDFKWMNFILKKY